MLPRSALFDKAGKPAVWVVDTASGTVALKEVSVARYETDRVVISSGLAKGEIVVTAGVNGCAKGRRCAWPRPASSGQP